MFVPNFMKIERGEDFFSLIWHGMTLKLILTEKGLKYSPSQIYNCDESGMPLQHKAPKVIAVKGTKKVRQTQITILGCANASGQGTPPMVVFQGKRFNPELSKGEILRHITQWLDGSVC